MLTPQQAVQFLTTVLQMENVEKKMEDKLLLLHEIVRRFHQHVPFQNLTLLAQDADERRLPSPADACQSLCSGQGGICYTLAIFARLLLTALGYDAFTVACSIRPSLCRPPYTHVATLARGVGQPDDLYLVEVGTSFPTFAPVPLHQLPQQYRNAFHEYRFVQEEEVIVRYQRQKPSAPDSDAVEWGRFYQFLPIPRDDSFLKIYQEPIYCQPGFGAKWYLMEIKMSIYPQDMAATISQQVLKVWHGDTNQVTVVQLNSAADFEEAIKKYFPMLTGVNVAKAVATAAAETENFRKIQEGLM